MVCERVFVTSQGSKYAEFQRALATRDLLLIRGAAAELAQVPLEDALAVCEVMATREPELYQRAALRWLARYCQERRDATLTNVAEAADALALLRFDPGRARARLRRVMAA